MLLYMLCAHVHASIPLAGLVSALARPAFRSLWPGAAPAYRPARWPGRPRQLMQSADQPRGRETKAGPRADADPPPVT